jgi:hypothetical protein
MTLEQLGYEKDTLKEEVIFKKKDKFGVSILAFNTRFKELEIYFVGLDNEISIEVLSPSIIKAIYNEMEELEWI